MASSYQSRQVDPKGAETLEFGMGDDGFYAILGSKVGACAARAVSPGPTYDARAQMFAALALFSSPLSAPS
ncbi:hypothetical protein IMZ48_20450 [Candidatus Bathyarchaeota archaeon]|nr:hypothetical protein [Candidatus Bathyarchaeota archaeon]